MRHSFLLLRLSTARAPHGLAAALLMAGVTTAHAAAPPAAAACADTHTGITLSPGFCAGCHGSDAKGSPIGADLTRGTWLWSDGSLAGLTKTISDGVATPKQHGGAMPPMGGAPLSPADVKAVAAYVWAIGHANQH